MSAISRRNKRIWRRARSRFEKPDYHFAGFDIVDLHIGAETFPERMQRNFYIRSKNLVALVYATNEYGDFVNFFLSKDRGIDVVVAKHLTPPWEQEVERIVKLLQRIGIPRRFKCKGSQVLRRRIYIRGALDELDKRQECPDGKKIHECFLTS